MNIILYGLRATGKTIIGKALAEKLNKKFIDTDDVRFKKFRQTTEEVVEIGGWPLFREQEKKVVLNIAENFDNSVISTGGGVMMDKENAMALKKNGKTILLTADIKIIADRIQKGENKENRPSLIINKSPEQETEEVWSQRKDQYLKLADLVIDTGKENDDDNIKKIISFYKKNNQII